MLEAAKINPVERCPAASHAPLAANLRLKWRPDLVSRLMQRTRLGRFLAFFVQMAKSGRWRSRPLPVACTGEIAVIALTSNQAAALDLLVEALEARKTPTRCYRSGGASKADSPENGDFERLRVAAAWWSLPFFPCLIYRMLTTRGYAGASYRWALDEYWLAYGLDVAARRWVRSARPAAVVLSNDHMLMPVTLAKAAQAEGVPTFYLQHACVTDKFPPLTMDYALLDGLDALEKYAGAGPSKTTTYLVGMAKFDSHADQINRRPRAERLGVCLSKADDLSKAEALLRRIAAADLGLEVTIRPHPATLGAALGRLESLAQELSMGISGPGQSAFAFLAEHDAIVAGVSSITLEAALMGVTPIHYALNDADSDWYGFTKRGLCRSFGDHESLIAYLRQIVVQREPPVEGAAYYCDTVETSYHGRSSDLAAAVIEGVRCGDPVDGSTWRRAPDASEMTVYRLPEAMDRQRS